MFSLIAVSFTPILIKLYRCLPK